MSKTKLNIVSRIIYGIFALLGIILGVSSFFVLIGGVSTDSNIGIFAWVVVFVAVFGLLNYIPVVFTGDRNKDLLGLIGL